MKLFFSLFLAFYIPFSAFAEDLVWNMDLAPNFKIQAIVNQPAVVVIEATSWGWWWSSSSSVSTVVTEDVIVESETVDVTVETTTDRADAPIQESYSEEDTWLSISDSTGSWGGWSSIVEYPEDWTVLSVTFSISDIEWDNIYFTITPSDWVVSVPSWWPISTPFTQEFVYVAPEWSVSWDYETVVITASDWKAITVKKIDVLIN